jgi:hypothetical protein
MRHRIKMVDAAMALREDVAVAMTLERCASRRWKKRSGRETRRNVGKR